MMKKMTLYLCFLLPLMATAQKKTQKVPGQTDAKTRLEAANQRQLLTEQSLVNGIAFRSVGPTVMSGRVTDLEVDPADPTHFYVAYASGGLWETHNNGQSFEPLFDQEAVMTIGDIAVNWQDKIIWIGTGENNSSRSSYAGTGIYKSMDNGKSWQHSGLADSHHIGRIVLHPTDKNKAWVAVLGHLYSPNNERGVYLTTDGGATWKRTLEGNPNAGAVDLVIGDRASNDPKVLYAAIWHRERRAWNFVESGAGTGIYKSTDGGLSWNKVSTKAAGFPDGDGAGRIGLAVASDDEQKIYALIDNQFRRDKKDAEKDEDVLTKEELRAMSDEAFLGLDAKRLNTFLKANRFPEKYTVEKIHELVKTKKIKPQALVEYLEDANTLLFDTPVVGAELYLSEDGGKSWKKTHEDYLDDIYFSYGYYFGLIRVDPNNAEQVYIAGVPILRSDDGGKTFKSINGPNVHVDHHALWVNPQKPGHLINGNDGGVNISYDNGETWMLANTPSVGQFYTVQVDQQEPYNVFGGLQDNGVWRGPSNYTANTRWHSEGSYPYKRIMGGDGMQIEVDSRNPNLVYTGYQFGNYFRIDMESGEQTYIQPKHELGERPLRFNWQTPIHLSVHNQDILYLGSNKLHRSMQKGNDWVAISEDLTNGGKQGDVAYGTLTSIHESPLRFGLLYTGSDDGLVHVSMDGGRNWKRISDALPQNLWVSRVRASAHDEGTVYVTLNGYRWDHFQSYIYVSKDYGKTWTQLGLNLPAEPVNVVKEDPENKRILYVGTDHGLYVSLDGGAKFMRMGAEMPAVAVHDLVVHPTAKDVVVGTHGRSIYIASVAHLQQLNQDLMDKKLHVFEPKPVRHSGYWGNSWSKWIEASTPKLQIPVWLSAADEKVKVTIKDGEGNTLQSYETKGVKGLNYLDYTLEVSEDEIKKYEAFLNKEVKEEDAKVKVNKASNGNYYLMPGKYEVTIESNGEKVTVPLTIKA